MDNSKLVAEIKKRDIPLLRAQENIQDPVIYLEMCLFGFSWRWFVSECEIRDDGDIFFYGCVAGDVTEWGYFTLPELENARCPLLINHAFMPMPFSQLKKEYDL